MRQYTFLQNILLLIVTKLMNNRMNVYNLGLYLLQMLVVHYVRTGKVNER